MDFLRGMCNIMFCAHNTEEEKRKKAKPKCPSNKCEWKLCFILFTEIHPTVFYYPLRTHAGRLPKTVPELKWNSSFFPLLSGEGSTIKGFTVGTTYRARHPDSLCLLFQATAAPDRPPAPASSLIQTTSLWFPATKRSRRLNLPALCPPPRLPPPSAHLPVSHRCGLDRGSRERRWMNMSRNRNGVKPKG